MWTFKYLCAINITVIYWVDYYYYFQREFVSLVALAPAVCGPCFQGEEGQQDC